MNCPFRVKQIILTDNEFEASSGGINDEIIAATNVNSALFPKYYRRAVGFTGILTARFVNKKLYFLNSIFFLYTVYGESSYDPCEKRDGYNYYWCHKFKDSNIGTWSDADFCRLVFIINKVQKLVYTYHLV